MKREKCYTILIDCLYTLCTDKDKVHIDKIDDVKYVYEYKSKSLSI